MQYLSQSIIYPDPCRATRVLRRLQQCRPLIPYAEVQLLRQTLTMVAQKKGFLLHAGDCSEPFTDSTPKHLYPKLQLLEDLSQYLENHRKQPILRIGRFAGQYAKPRSQLKETQHGKTLPNYRGDLINDSLFTLKARTPDPLRLLQGYRCMRASVSHLSKYPSKQPFFTSHEALHLAYEKALSRQNSQKKWYNSGTHFPWLGVRTQQDPSYLQYLQTIANPIGLKIGPHTSPQTLLSLLRALNPQQALGKIVCITRLGHINVSHLLPPLIQAVQDAGLPVLWICDPMHGNTSQQAWQKVRYFNDIRSELEQSIQIHRQLESYLGGIHLEITPLAVVECLGGMPETPSPSISSPCLVDPQLNRQQAETLLQSCI
ncbi:MAG: 3-deoxy-7-phosphoheptulonate synthase [Legionellaceae bacterium]|nr:3-deoxy-7-phosphoheptulonate synthase [Legionellaceae bacterium]